jgi:hypothetical protein
VLDALMLSDSSSAANPRMTIQNIIPERPTVSSKTYTKTIDPAIDDKMTLLAPHERLEPVLSVFDAVFGESWQRKMS